MQQANTQATKIDTNVLRRRLKEDESRNSHKRKFERHKIFAVGVLTLMNNSQQIDGVIDEVSAGGLRFHPASHFIMERNGETVSMALGDLQMSGKIRATRADGYGVQLLDVLEDDQLQSIVEQYQL